MPGHIDTGYRRTEILFVERRVGYHEIVCMMGVPAFMLNRIMKDIGVFDTQPVIPWTAFKVFFGLQEGCFIYFHRMNPCIIFLSEHERKQAGTAANIEHAVDRYITDLRSRPCA